MENENGFVPLAEGLSREEDRRARELMAATGIGEDKVRAYAEDLMSIIEAGFVDYFRELGLTARRRTEKLIDFLSTAPLRLANPVSPQQIGANFLPPPPAGGSQPT